MTVDTCIRLAEHCKSMGDTAGYEMYMARAARKKERHPDKYPQKPRKTARSEAEDGKE